MRISIWAVEVVTIGETVDRFLDLRPPGLLYQVQVLVQAVFEHVVLSEVCSS